MTAQSESPRPEGAKPSCRHLLAPLVMDPKDAKRLQVRNYRECKACGASLWDDGSPMEYKPEEEAK